MAANSSGEQVTRRLRSREVVLMQPPLQSLAAASIAVGNNNENPKRTKAAGKRSAVDGSLTCNLNGAPTQHVKKRAVLGNITNQISTCSDQPLKLQATNSITTRSKLRSQSSQIDKALHGEESNPRHLSACSLVTSEDIYTCHRTTSRAEVGTQALILLQASCSQNAQKNFLPKSRPKNMPKESGAGEMQGAGHLRNEGCSKKSYVDIDCEKDPRMCSTYANEIYLNLRMAEFKRYYISDFLEDIQVDVSSGMRGILVDWLVEVSEEYKLVPDTLYLTVSYIDRYLSGNIVSRQRLQLLGVACMLIASKCEEIFPPQVEEFCYITDNTYNRDEVLEMERQVLKYLRFELAGPTIKTFLRRFVRAAQAEKMPLIELEYLANYLAELTLLEYDFVHYLPSMIAGAAVFVAKLTLYPEEKPWTRTIWHYCQYQPSQLKRCINDIHGLQRNVKSCTLRAIREKYKQLKFKCVANLLPPEQIPCEYFDDVK